MFDNFISNESSEGRTVVPPTEVIAPIISMNVIKRTSATRRAEQLVEKGQIEIPLSSLIPTFMNSGHEIPGIEDPYLMHDHPSQELFAYNRLGKKAWLNRRFGQHCLKAVSFAHPHGSVQPSTMPTRIKAHATGADIDHSTDSWIIASTKTPIARIDERGRQAQLISRVTGAIDMSNPLLHNEEIQAISELAQYDAERGERLTPHILAQKAVLLDALERHEGDSNSAFHPVIQTVYLTQQPQK